jgi:succinate dehydrogenase/fumarate reductase flavoprotein subunit
MLARIDTPACYAMAMYDGVIGTAGGLGTDARGRVRSMRGGTIDGLYAVGSSAASAFGPAYPGGGSTLVQALTFGYLAGLDLAELTADVKRARATVEVSGT